MADNILLRNGLLNAFPSVASFIDFKENDREISRRAIPGIIKYAFKHKIIHQETEEAWVEFLTQNDQPATDKPLQAGLTFSDILDVLSGNLSVNALIAQLEITARELSLPEIQAPMITRLKKKFVVNTPKKRALLRILAFKLAQKGPDLNWNYELLLQLPESSSNDIEPVHETAGVTITFHLQSQGEIIVPADVAWLKNELAACMDYLKLETHTSKKVIETTGATSFSLRSPKKPGPQDEPRLYNEAIRNTMAIAHQMSARWLLSTHSNLQKKLVIIVHAGAFAESHFIIQRILEINLSAESAIYLTDFARLCALYASVKIGLELHTKPAQRSTGYGGDIWSVSYFISYNYYDYIPGLLEAKMLPKSTADAAYEDFKRALHFPEHAGQSAFGGIAAMHRYPQSALLLTEIAKVLRARQMPFEADAVLSNLLLTSPHNLVARMMRMLIYANIAQAQTNFESARLAFDRADAEGGYIVECCKPESDIWHEIGATHFSRSIKYLNFLREADASRRRPVSPEDIFTQLEHAKRAFLKSMTVSATGKATHSLYMYVYTLCLIDLFSSDNRFFGKADFSTLTDHISIFFTVVTRVFRNIGWLRSDLQSDPQKLERTFENLLLTLNLVIARYENLVLCRSSIPQMKFMFASILWDSAPAITPQVCLLTLEWLKIAKRETEKLIKDNISVYHVVTGTLSAEKFLAHISDTIDLIGKHVSPDDLKQGRDTPQLRLGLKELSRIKLMLLEIDRSQTEKMTLCA